MKCMFLLIMLSVCLTACEHHPASLSSMSDAEIQKKLAGTWRDQKGESYSIHVVASNGNYAGQAVFKDADGIRNVTEEGTWIIRDRKLIQTCTKNSSPMAYAYIPTTESFIIVRLDERELVMKLEERPEFDLVYHKQIK